MTWRHAPHGVRDEGSFGSPFKQETASRTGRAPDAMHEKMATRSAHIVRGYDADSMLQPT
jgi:hypothetical protein